MANTGEQNQEALNGTQSWTESLKQQEGIIKWEARLDMKALMAELPNPFTLSQEQWDQFADSGETKSNVSGSDKELLGACDANGDWVIKWLKERGGELKVKNDNLDKNIVANKAETSANKAEIAASKERIEEIRKRLLDKVSN